MATFLFMHLGMIGLKDFGDVQMCSTSRSYVHILSAKMRWNIKNNFDVRLDVLFFYFVKKLFMEYVL